MNDWKSQLQKLNDENSKITEEKLVIGRIIQIELNEQDGLVLKNGYNTRRKFIIIVGVDADKYYYATILINSDEYDFTDEILEAQYYIFQKDYPHFLDIEKERSYVDCSQIKPIARNRLINEGKDKQCINSKDLEEIFNVLKGTGTIPNKEKKRFGIIPN